MGGRMGFLFCVARHLDGRGGPKALCKEAIGWREPTRGLTAPVRLQGGGPFSQAKVTCGRPWWTPSHWKPAFVRSKAVGCIQPALATQIAGPRRLPAFACADLGRTLLKHAPAGRVPLKDVLTERHQDAPMASLSAAVQGSERYPPNWPWTTPRVARLGREISLTRSTADHDHPTA